MAHVAWRAARVAAHYPAHFHAAVLDHLGLGTGGGMYPILVYVVEARRHGIAVRGPTINGPWESTTDGGPVRCGLLVLQGAINIGTLQRVHAAAQQRPFASVADVASRAALGANDLEKLIAAGALDELAPSRRHARWEVQYAYRRRSDQASLLDEQSWQHPMSVEAERRDERAWEEYATLGFPLSVDHPLDLVRDQLHGIRIVYAEELRHHIGDSIDVAGVVVAGRRIHTAGDRLMVFTSLCDPSGTMELTLFEGAAERYTDALVVGAMLVVHGVVSANHERGIGVEVQRLRTLAS